MTMAMLVGSVMGVSTSLFADEIKTTNYNFESELSGWENRGDAKVELVKTAAKEGKQSIYVTGRTANWNGVSKEMISELQKGQEYTISAWVKYDEGADNESMSMTLQQNVSSSADTSYIQIANAAAKKGEWTHLEGKVTLPNDATSAVVYFEANTAELNFYVDDITITGKVSSKTIQKDVPALKDVYKDYFKLGTAVSTYSTNGLVDIDKQAILKHFNSLTCGNEMKPDFILDYDATIAYMKENPKDQVHPQVNLNAAKSMLDFAKENKIPMRGHVLTWHSQTPNWFFKENFSKDPNAKNVSKEVMLERLENYIKVVFETIEKEYPDVEFYAFDVVNEAINPDTENGLRLPAKTAKTTGDDGNNENAGDSMWMAVVGDEFIEKAFEYARKYAPKDVKLAYNDYNECDPKKAEIMYNLCKKLKEQGNLDVIGMQGHYNMTTPSVSQLEDAIRKYASLGVEIQITELDVTQPDGSEEGMLKQAYRYKEIFDTLKKLDKEGINIGACILWGIDDGTSWRSESKPLLFDANYQVKPAYWAAVDASKLAVVKKEYNVAKMTEDQDATWKCADDMVLTTVDGKEIGKAQLVWDDKNLYVKVSAADGKLTDKDNVKIWVDVKSDGGDKLQKDDVTKESALKEGEVISIPINDLKQDQAMCLDMVATIGGKKATWNASSNADSANPSTFGKITLRKATQYLAATKGTPTIDGKVDDAWKDAKAIDVNMFTVGNSGATATAKAMWDENNIYVLVDVKDKLLSKESINAYEQDSVEVFIDEDHAKTATYDKGDVQYRVNFDNEHSINGLPDAECFKSAAEKTEEGYLIEFALPYNIANFKEGQLVGFEVQVNNDEDGNGTRDSVANWNDATGQGWSSTEQYGVLELK